MSRESPFQDRLRDIIQAVISKYKFDGLKFSKVERGFKIGARETDLTLFDKVGAPFLIIETKRKIEGPSYWRSRELFDPLGKATIGQAISYVALYARRGGHIPYFATANPDQIAIFKTPERERVLEFVDIDKVRRREYEDVIRQEKYSELLKQLVTYERMELSEEFISRLLDTISKDYLGTRVSRVSPGWAIIDSLRGLVERLSMKCEPIVRQNMERKEELKRQLEDMTNKLGYRPDAHGLTKMMVYVLMNKIIFYKVLEQKYRDLPRMINLPTDSKVGFLNALNGYFDKAIEVTKDFELIFKTGIYDMIDFPDEREVLEYVEEFVETLDTIRIEEIGEYIGYIYEELIPSSERHQLGQFYTPLAICELIAKWAIRGSDDKVLDPGCGSGGFLLAAYRVLTKLKTGRDEIPPSKGVHEKILAQLWGIDTNTFPAHLSAMNLAMRDVRAPATGLNIIERDFLLIEPNQNYLLPPPVRTPAGVEFRREMRIPMFDAVIGNPPYTRWVEIPDSTQKALKKKLGELVRKYGLTPQVSRGVEPGIYTYWMMHATRFLKDGGRLGMIISNLWMQTDYGIRFGNFLLDNYKVKAIIDFTLRLFAALISTCIVLAEKEGDASKRDENDIVFIHIPGHVEEKIEVNEILETIEKRRSDRLDVKVVKQKEIPRDEKWIKVFFGLGDIFRHPLMVKLSEYFEPSRGNTVWSIWALSHGRRPDVGASDFSYLSPSKIRSFNLEKFSYPNVPLDRAIIYPAITSARDAIYFTFTEDDWKRLYNEDNECSMFICHKPRSELPKEVVDYIKWGEPICPQCNKGLTLADGAFKCEGRHVIPIDAKCITRLRETRGGGRFACETESAKAREREKGLFYGWYDLGVVEPAPVFAVYVAWHKTRFVLCRFPVAMSHLLIALRAKVALDEGRLKALLAYLNSSFSQYYIETQGIRSGGGIISFEVNIARNMPILDVRKLEDVQIAKLASLFDKLESEARRIGGASGKEQVEKLKPIIYEIDEAVTEILGLSKDLAKSVEKRVDMLIERRIAGSKEERREIVKGEVEMKVKPRRRSRRISQSPTSSSLDKFM